MSSLLHLAVLVLVLVVAETTAQQQPPQQQRLLQQQRPQQQQLPLQQQRPQQQQLPLQQQRPQQQQLPLLQQQRPQQQQQQQQQNRRIPDDALALKLRRQQGDIDAVSPDTPLLKLSKDDITNLMNNPKSVAILTRCFVEPTKCKSASAVNIMNQMNAVTVAGGKCKDCTAAEEKYLDDLMYILVQGYTTRYIDQWQLLFPHVKVLVAAAALRTG